MSSRTKRSVGQVDRPQPQRCRQLQQPARTFVGDGQLPPVTELEHFLVEASGPIEVGHADANVIKVGDSALSGLALSPPLSCSIATKAW